MTATPQRRALLIRQQLQALGGDPIRWAAVDRHLGRGEWSQALGELQALASELQTHHRALSSLAGAINRRHWSPLLEQAKPPESPTCSEPAP